METSLLTQELEPLNAQIAQLQSTVMTLESELRDVQEELDSVAIDQQQFEVLQEACTALDRLQELGAGKLFWDGLPEGIDTSEHTERLLSRIADFEAKTLVYQQNRESLKRELEQQLTELDILFDEVQQAHDREELRQEEFIYEREITQFPYRPMLMPWSKEAESEKRFRKTLMIALLCGLLFSISIPLITVPVPDRSSVDLEITARMAMLIKKEPLMPEPEIVQKQVKAEESKPEPEKAIKQKEIPEKKQPKAKPAGGATEIAKKKAASVGVLAFKSSFSDLMEEVPVAKLGSEARVKNMAKRIPGEARAQRSLVAMQAQGGSSGGISNYKVSRNLGDGGKGGGSGYGNAGEIGGVGTAQVSSSMAGLTEEAGRRLSDGLGAARTDEEIQIVFDRYKATLYRIYNKELRKDPTLRGKLLLRLTIEPDGVVSTCKVESSDLDSPELMDKIVDRVKKFNFGPKEDVPKITILYPIDFLPAG